MRKLSLLPLLTILTYSLGVELCSGIWLPSSACLRPGVIHPQRPQRPPSCRSKEKEVHFRRSDNMCIYLYQKYKHRNPNTNTEGDPATRLRWLLAGLGPEGSAGRDVQGRARCRRGVAKARWAQGRPLFTRTPRVAGYRESPFYGVEEDRRGQQGIQGSWKPLAVGQPLTWLSGGPARGQDWSALLPANPVFRSTLAACSELMSKCCGVLESAYHRFHRWEGLQTDRWSRPHTFLPGILLRTMKVLLHKTALPTP